MTDSLACSLTEGGWGWASLFLLWAEGTGVSRRGTAGMACPPLRCCCEQGACGLPGFCSPSPVLVPDFSEVITKGWFGVFLYLLSRIYPSCARMKSFSVP